MGGPNKQVEGYLKKMRRVKIDARVSNNIAIVTLTIRQGSSEYLKDCA